MKHRRSTGIPLTDEDDVIQMTVGGDGGIDNITHELREISQIQDQRDARSMLERMRQAQAGMVAPVSGTSVNTSDT